MSGDGWADAFTRPRFIEAAWFTLWQATLSTVLTVAAALPLDLGRVAVQLPRQVSRQGLRDDPVCPSDGRCRSGVSVGVRRRTLGALIAAHVFYNVAVVVRTVGGVWSRIDPTVEEAAAVLGASPIRRFRTVVFPLIRPALASASAIVFLFCFTSFGTVLVLGQGRLRTLEVEIYQQAVNFLDLPVAAALSLIQLATVTAMLVVSARTQQRASTLILASEARLPAPRQGTATDRTVRVILLRFARLAVDSRWPDWSELRWTAMESDGGL